MINLFSIWDGELEKNNTKQNEKTYTQKTVLLLRPQKEEK